MCSKDEEVTIKGLEDYKVDSDEEMIPLIVQRNQRVKFPVRVILPRISTFRIIHRNWFRRSSDTSI